MCCGIPQISNKFFMKEDGTKVQATVDHVLLRSLGGPNTEDNLVIMCYECNQLRSNLFAELDEFIHWYWSGEPLPKEKNFSYLYKYKRNKNRFENYTFKGNTFVKSSAKLINHSTNNIPVQKSKTESVLVRTIEMNGYMYNEYKHPLYGTSHVKVEN